jgi:phage baseplate assembly protein W
MVETTTELYGVDFRLTNRDLSISSSGGYDINDGLDNLIQAVNNRLVTELGSLAYDASYGIGINLVIGEKNIDATIQLLKSAVITAIRSEPRIDSITKLTITPNSTNPQIIYISLEMVPISSNEVITTNLLYPLYLNQANLSVESEAATSISRFRVNTLYDIYSVKGVWLATDTSKIGKNYFYSAILDVSGTFSGKQITLIEELPSTLTQVIIDYNKTGAELV